MADIDCAWISDHFYRITTRNRNGLSGAPIVRAVALALRQQKKGRTVRSVEARGYWDLR